MELRVPQARRSWIRVMVIITGLVVITGIVPPSRVHAKSVNLVHQCKVGMVLIICLIHNYGMLHRPTQIHGLARFILDTEHLNTVWLVVLAHIPLLLGATAHHAQLGVHVQELEQ